MSNLCNVPFEQPGKAREAHKIHTYTKRHNICDNETIQRLASNEPRQPLKQVKSLMNQLINVKCVVKSNLEHFVIFLEPI